MFARRFATIAATVLTSYTALFSNVSNAACTSMIPADQLVTPGTLALATNPTLKPLQYIDGEGNLKGMNIDLGNEIAKRLCLTMSFMRMDFPSMVPAMSAARFDGIDTGMFWTEARSKSMYTVPYAMATITVVVSPNSKSTLPEIKDLAGHSIGVEADSYQEKWLREQVKTVEAAGGKAIDVKAFQTASDVMAAMRAGQLDYSAFPSYAASGFIKDGAAKMVLGGLGGSQTTMAFRKRAVAVAVAKAMDDMRADGTYAKILDSYGMQKLPAAHIELVGTGPG